MTDRTDVVDPGELVLVTGATGYVGGRLVDQLLDAGYRVRCLARTPAKIADAPWSDRVEVVQGDVLEDLGDSMNRVAAVYYQLARYHPRALGPRLLVLGRALPPVRVPRPARRHRS